jgi:hypothetical protein
LADDDWKILEITEFTFGLMVNSKVDITTEQLPYRNFLIIIVIHKTRVTSKKISDSSNKEKIISTKPKTNLNSQKAFHSVVSRR